MKAEDGIPALETALSLTSSAEEFMAVFLHNLDALYNHYSRPSLRKWRFRRHCARQSALSNICNELLSGREDVVTNVIQKDKRQQIKAKKRMWAPLLPSFTTPLVTSLPTLPSITTPC